MEHGMPEAASSDHLRLPSDPTDSSSELRQAAPEGIQVPKLLDQLLGEVRELRQQFDAKIRYDEVRERQVAGMQEELAAHRQGLSLRILRPVLNDLIAIHDDLTQAVQATAGGDESPAEYATTLASLRESILETLHRNGVTDFTVDGEAVDRARQRVIKVEETGDATADRQVARRLRPGFELDGKVLRPEWVVAYRYVPAPADARQ
jgi:molecular chaperone GrpE